MSKQRELLLMLMIALAGGGAWVCMHRENKQAEGAVRTASAVKGFIEDTVEATGSVAPLNRVEIKPPISGRVEELLVDEGAGVRSGQTIAWMSSNDRAAILDAARAQGPDELKRWQDSYKPTPIVAPLSGVVILRNVVVGQTVDPSTVLYAMSDRLIVVAQVDESDIGRVHLGMSARIVLDAYPDKSVSGKVFDILYEGKNVSNVITYGVKIRLDPVPSFFRSQMTANVSFVVNRRDDVVLVPAGAVRESPGGGKRVLVPGPDGKPAPREVATGIESGDTVEIVSGLNAGDQVVLGRGRYTPQQGPQTSPLTFGGRPSGTGANSGQAPRPRRTQ